MITTVARCASCMRDVRVSDENNVKGNTDVEARVSDGVVKDDEMIGSVKI